MSEEQNNLIQVCKDFFKDQEIDQINTGESNHYFNNAFIVDIKESSSKVIFRFKGKVGYPNKCVDYEKECVIGFENMNKKTVSELLGPQQYNYAFIEKAIKHLYTLGENYKLFKTLKPVKNLRIEQTLVSRDLWTHYENTQFASTQNISNIQFSNFYKTELHKLERGAKKLKGKNMTLCYHFVVRNNELHPIAIIDYPVAPNASIELAFDIHPAQQQEAEERLIKYSSELKERLIKRVNQVLKKELQFTNKTLATLTTEDKINYLTVAEMSEI